MNDDRFSACARVFSAGLVGSAAALPSAKLALASLALREFLSVMDSLEKEDALVENLINDLADHIVDTTGSRRGSDSAELVERAHAFLRNA